MDGFSFENLFRFIQNSNNQLITNHLRQHISTMRINYSKNTEVGSVKSQKNFLLMETEFKRRRLTPTAIIIQSVLRIENKNYPEKGKTIIAVCETYGKRYTESKNPVRVQSDF